MSFKIVEIGPPSEGGKGTYCRILWNGQSMRVVVSSFQPQATNVELQFEMGYQDILQFETIGGHTDDDSRITQVGDDKFELLGRVISILDNQDCKVVDLYIRAGAECFAFERPQVEVDNASIEVGKGVRVVCTGLRFFPY